MAKRAKEKVQIEDNENRSKMKESRGIEKNKYRYAPHNDVSVKD